MKNKANIRIPLKARYSLLLLLFFLLGSLQLFAQENEGKVVEGLSFQVQISASVGVKKDINKLKKDHNLTSVSEFHQNNYYKYTTGVFYKYVEAAVYRDELIQNHNLKDAFVIAVKDGQILKQWSRYDTGLPGTTIEQKPKIQVENKVEKPIEKKPVKDSVSNKEVSSFPPAAVFPIESDSLQSDSTIIDEAEQNLMKVELSYREKIWQKYTAFIEDNISSSRLVIILFSVTIMFVISFLFLLFVMIIVKFYKQGKDRKLVKLKEKYGNVLAEYLFSEEAGASIPSELSQNMSSLKKEALVQEVLRLQKNLSGDSYHKINQVYLQLGLNMYSLSKLKSRKWHIAAQGINELAQMDITSATKRIQDMIESRNDILRMEAQTAVIRLNKTNPFSFFGTLKHNITEWEKLNIHYMIQHHDVEAPEFKQWLHLENNSLVIFCLEMIALYKQNDAIPEVEKLTSSPDAKVREYAYKCLQILGISESSELIQSKYLNENSENRMRIIEALGNMSDPKNIEFLEKLLMSEMDFEMRFKIASSIKAYGSQGVELLNKYVDYQDNDLKRILKHLSDPRI